MLTVDAFPSSAMRPALFKELERLAADVVAACACCELWINGSFLTEKPEPNDIDLCFAIFVHDFERMDSHVQANIDQLLNGGKAYSPVLDTYVCFRFLRDDPRALADTSDYWSEKWGKGWDNWLKGFAVIKFGESDVGLRLFA